MAVKIFNKAQKQHFVYPLIVVTTLVLFIVASLITFVQTKQKLQENLFDVKKGFESSLGQALNNVGLISRLSTIQSSLYFGAPEPAEKILNQSIFQEPFTDSLAIFDRSKSLFSSNVLDSNGAFIGTPEFALTELSAELPRTKIITDKYGEVDMMLSNDSSKIIFEKKILKDDEELGSLLITLNGAKLIKNLVESHEVLSDLPIQYFISTVPTNWQCFQSEQFNSLSVCGLIELSDVLMAAKSPILVILIISILIGLVLLLGALYIQKEAQKDIAVQKALVDMASQVAHDIRSPLAVLKAVAHDDLKDHPAQNQLEGVIDRIHQISSTLLKEQVRCKEQNADTTVQNLIKNLVHEKQIEFKNLDKINIEFKDQSKSDIRTAYYTELSRVVSNIINNSVEALTDQGLVKILLTEIDQFFEITISDNGKGISKNNLSKVFNRGFSFGKVSGNGFGLSAAKEFVEQQKGKIEIDSKLQLGTTVKISLPKQNHPAQEGKIEPDLILIDNDPLVLKHWSVVARRKHLALLPYKNPIELKTDFHDKNIPIYVDKNLDDGISGFNVAKDLMKAGFQNIYLCTGDNVDPKSLPPYIKGVIGKDFPSWDRSRAHSF